MGKLNAFQISFTDNAAGVYHAGQLIQGHLLVDLQEPMSMRAIILEFVGYANVHWTERHSSGSGKNRKTRTVSYNNNEVYFSQKVFVWGSGEGGGLSNLFKDSPEHPAGRHIYPFQFQLPPNLPSSFEGEWGRVRYAVAGTMDKPWKFNHTTKMPFTVHSAYDLNQDARSRNPCQNQGSKTLCCLCCKSGPISAVVRTDRTGYVPGEFIVVNGEVDNKSNRTLTSTKLALRMITTFHSRSKSRAAVRIVHELKRGEVGPGDSEIWNGERLHIPPLPPSDLIHCNIIDIKYYVVLIADPSGPAFDLECLFNVVVGTVPLRDVFGTFASSPFAPAPLYNTITPSGKNPNNNSIAPAPELDPSAPPLQMDLYNVPAASPSMPPPPSYAESVFGKVNIKEEGDSEYTQGSLDYAPKYTYYTFDQSQPGPM